MSARETSSYGRVLWGINAIANRSRPSGDRHRSPSNSTKPKGRRIGGAHAEVSAGSAIHQSLGHDGKTTKLRPRNRPAPSRASQEGRAIQRGAEVLGLTARRK